MSLHTALLSSGAQHLPKFYSLPPNPTITTFSFGERCPMTPLLSTVTYCGESPNLTLNRPQVCLWWFKADWTKIDGQWVVGFLGKNCSLKKHQCKTLSEGTIAEPVWFWLFGVVLLVACGQDFGQNVFCKQFFPSWAAPPHHCPCTTSLILQLRIRKKFKDLYAIF